MICGSFENCIFSRSKMGCDSRSNSLIIGIYLVASAPKLYLYASSRFKQSSGIYLFGPLQNS